MTERGVVERVPSTSRYVINGLRVREDSKQVGTCNCLFRRSDLWWLHLHRGSAIAPWFKAYLNSQAKRTLIRTG